MAQSLIHILLFLLATMVNQSCTNKSPEAAQQRTNDSTKVRVPDLAVRTSNGDVVRLSALYKQAPMLLSVYLGVGCPMCVMSMKQLSQHAYRIKTHGWNVFALSNDTPEENRIALEKPNFDSSFVQPGGGFAVELLSDSNHVAMEFLGCYRRSLETERHGMFLIDQQGVIRFSVIDRRPYQQWETLIDSIKSINAEIKMTSSVTQN